MYYLNPNKVGLSYGNLQSTKAPGLVAFPDEFMSEYFKEGKRAAGFIKIEHDGEKVTSCTWDDDAYAQWELQFPAPDPTEVLNEKKQERILQSKTDLEIFLAENPITWTDGYQYSITREKQQQLTSKILSATLAAQTKTPYNLTWNSTGEVCKAWTLEELSALAFAIDARVTALVTYQQEKEIEINNAESEEALNSIVVDYSTVGNENIESTDTAESETVANATTNEPVANATQEDTPVANATEEGTVN